MGSYLPVAAVQLLGPVVRTTLGAHVVAHAAASVRTKRHSHVHMLIIHVGYMI